MRLPALLAAFLSLAATLRAEDWPQFRGAAVSGLSSETKLPAEWSADKGVAWKAKIEGAAWSSPIVWGDKVFVTTAVAEGRGGAAPARGDNAGDDAEKEPPKKGRRPGGFGGGGFGGGGEAPNTLYRWQVLCLDRASGKELWKQTALERKPTIPTHRTNTYASETPVTDGQRVYAYFGMCGVYCYDMTGKLLWSQDLGSYSMRNGWGTGSSPVLAGERLFVQCDNEDKSFLVAFHAKTGEEAWRVSRSERSTWSTPYVWKNKDRTELIAVGATVRSYDPASGKVLWEMGGLSGRVAATPVGDQNLLYLGTGGGQSGPGPLYAIKAGAAGDITPKEGASAGIAWSAERAGPSMPSPLVYDGHLYVVDQRGTVTCFEAATGKQLYKERLPGARQCAASPWAYDGKIFCLDQEGQSHVLAAGAEFKVLGKNDVGETCWASPAIAGGALFLRGAQHLFCIR